MLLEQILTHKCIKDDETFQMLSLIVSQLSFLLCLVNDVLDIKLIRMNRFEAKLCAFDPGQTLHFIKDMFRPQTEI